MQAKIEKLTSLVESNSYCTLALSGEDVPLAPHCVRQILRAPHPMYPKTFDHKEDHRAMEEMLKKVCERINSYDHLRNIEVGLKRTFEWLNSVTFENPETEYEKMQLLENIVMILADGRMDHQQRAESSRT